MTRVSCLFYLVLVLVLAMPAASQETQHDAMQRIDVASREGVAELRGAEAATMLLEVVRDKRYLALERIAADRGLRFEQLRAKAAQFSEGYHAAIVPALNAEGEERGFLASADGTWTLSLEIDQSHGRLLEAYRARLDESGNAFVEAVPLPNIPEPEHPSANTPATGPRAAVPDAVITYPTKSCRYVSQTGFNFGCSSRLNAWGMYYVTTTRYGYTPDPRSPTWRACYRGYIHICPRYETSNPFNWVTCGTAPAHPLG